MFTTLVAALAIQQAGPDWTRMVNGYKLVHWSNPDDDRQTMYLFDRKKKLVFTLQDFHVGIDDISAHTSSYFVRPKAVLFDLAGKGKNDLVMSEWSGGAHGSMAYYIWSLGTRPRCLLAYDKNNMWGSSSAQEEIQDFHFADLNHDGKKEIISFYDGFSYLEDFGTYGGMLPFILEYRNGQYRNATPKYKSVLQQWIHRAHLEVTKVDRKGEDASRYFRELGVRLYGLGIINRSVPETTCYLSKELPRADFQWVLARRKHIRKVVGEMDGRLRSIRLYSEKPFTVN